MVTIHIKYYSNNSQDGYDTANFHSYEEFTKWYIKKFREINIVNITEL
jgi:hypothetical protein